MSKTFRDNTRWRWHNHFKTRGVNPSDEPRHVFDRSSWRGQSECWCHRTREQRDVAWISPYASESGVPSWWNRIERRAERAHYRDLDTRARSGHLDWDDIPAGTSRSYRRPWYW